jgi:hypothetical protein
MDNILERSKKIALEVARIAKNTDRIPMFVIENTAGVEKNVVFSPIRYTPSVVSGVAIIRTIEDAKKIVKSIDGIVKTILVDVEKKNQGLSGIEEAVKREAVKSEILTVKLNDMTVEATDALIAQLVGKVYGKRVTIIGAGNIGSKLALKLVERGAEVVITRKNREKEVKKIAEALNLMKPRGTLAKVTGTVNNLEAAKGADVVICFAPKTPVVTSEIVNAMNSQGLLIDGGIGTIYPDAINIAVRQGIRVLRLDMRAGFAGGVTAILETRNLIKHVMGRNSIAGIPVVAGGFVGRAGDVLVDNISKPTQVIGVADGRGGTLKDPKPEFRRRMEKVLQEIRR